MELESLYGVLENEPGELVEAPFSFAGFRGYIWIQKLI